MNTNIVKTEDGVDYNNYDQPVMTCKNEGCNELTTMTGTQLCDGCWEERRKSDNEVHVIDCCPEPLFKNEFVATACESGEFEDLYLLDPQPTDVKKHAIEIVDTSETRDVLVKGKKYKVTVTIEEVES